MEQVEQSVVPKSDDGTTDGTIFENWGKISLEAGDCFGKTLRVVDESTEYMTKAGFQDVTQRRFRVPIGTWPKDSRLKELGRYNRLQWEKGIEGWTMRLLTGVLGVGFLFSICSFQIQMLRLEFTPSSGNEKKSRHILRK